MPNTDTERVLRARELAEELLGLWRSDLKRHVTKPEGFTCTEDEFLDFLDQQVESFVGMFTRIKLVDEHVPPPGPSNHITRPPF